VLGVVVAPGVLATTGTNTLVAVTVVPARVPIAAIWLPGTNCEADAGWDLVPNWVDDEMSTVTDLPARDMTVHVDPFSAVI